MIPAQKKQGSSQMSIAGERAPGTQGNLKADIASIRDPDGPRAGNNSAANAETFLFNKHYNKELKLCEDEIPMVLCELNESALAYLNRDQFDNALLLLQKAHGVLDVVDLSGSKRDQYIALQLFHNMAMCYQKQGQLEECALCLETTLDHLGTEYASDQNISFAMRLYKMKIEVRLRLQFCAILSQLHRHKEAFEQALEGIKIAHLIIRDKISVSRLYSKRIDFLEIYGNGNDENQTSLNIEKSDNLSQSEANVSKYYQSSQKQKKSVFEEKKKQQQQKKINNIKDDQSKSSNLFEDDQKNKYLEENIEDRILNLQTEQSFLNNLEGSISLVEKTSKKLLPIYKYVQQKIEIIEKKKLFNQFSQETHKNADDKQDQNNNSSINEDSSDVEVMINGNKQNSQRPISEIKGKNKQKEKNVKKNPNIDLRHILGFLNQTEWIQNLNIGNIMQISPIKFEDLILIRRNEECLSRESFLDVISFLIVGYFCASTEIRFIIQLKDEIPKFDNFIIDSKTQESELWHTMSLDIACSFLPSDCPLLNHILLSYQKHHAPSQSQILENQILDEKLRVIKPLNGIDNSKFQPIVRVLQNIKIDLPYSQMPPASKTVSKMIQEINMKYKYSQERSAALFKQVNKNVISTPSGLNNNKNKFQSNQSPVKKLNAYQQQKIQKIETIIAKYSKDIGLEKNQVLRFLLGENQNHNYYVNQEEDFKNNNNQVPNNQMSQYDSGLFNNRFYQNPQIGNVQQQGRPQSQKETVSSRRNQDNQIQNNQTGIAAKIAYNNLGKSQNEENNLNNVGNQKNNLVQGQASSLQYNKNGIGSREWTLSPQAQLKDTNKNSTSFPILSSVDNSSTGVLDQENRNSIKDEEFIKNQLQQAQVRSQRLQMNQKISQTEEKQNQFDQKSTSVVINDLNQKDNSLFNDINYQKLNHEKSYNEQHDTSNKFILNQSDFMNEIDSQQHHNLSINANSQGMISQGGTVRQQNKRIQSKDRDKVQRPRSSKGYRGNNIQMPPNQTNVNISQNTSQNQSLALSGMNQNVSSAINIQHQLSQNPLNTAGSIQQATSLNSSSTATGPKFQANKSEERALKSQQNQRPIINKNQRQKTAGGNTTHAQSTVQIVPQTAQGFTKEVNIIQQNNLQIGNQNQGLQQKKLVNLTNQLISQSSSQLPSAQITGNLTKLTKKQIQQMQQHQGQPISQFQTNNPNINSFQSNSQIQFAQASLNSNLNNYNSANQSKPAAKSKLNYDDLKKLLIKDQQQQNGNLTLLNQQNAQSQISFAGMGNIEQNGMVLAQDQGRGRSQPTSKQKKNNAQSTSQLTQMQNVQNYQKLNNMQSAQSLEKLDQIQVGLDDHLNQNLQQQMGNYQSQINREPKDMMFVNSEMAKVDFSRDSSQNQSQKELARNKFVLDQMKIGKGQQQIQQPRKVGGPISAPHQGQPQISLQQVTSQNFAIQQSHLTQQQAQQLYLNQLQGNGPAARPSSSQKYKVKPQQGPTQPNQPPVNPQQNSQSQQQRNVNQQNLINQRDSNNKSALSTIGKHQTVIGSNPIQQSQQNLQPHLHQQQIIQQQIIMNVNNNISGGINNINNNGQNQNSNSASLKRREKGRLIMQEWLVKSGQNLLTNPNTQIAISNVINPQKKNQEQAQ